MDKNTEKTIWIILYVSFIFTFLFLIFISKENRVNIGILSSLLIISISTRLSIFYAEDKTKKLGKFLIFIDLIIIYWCMLIDSSSISNLYMLIIVIDSIFFHENNFGFLMVLLSYVSYILAKVPNFLVVLNFKELIFILLIGLAIFTFVTSILYFTKHQIIQKQKLMKSLKEIEDKNKQLERAYKKLKEHSEALEDMAAIKERNRIAREIHDTVGHTLTTVLVEIEAGKRLLDKNKALAIEKINLAQEQVRKGLQEIRRSVRMLKEGKEIIAFIPSIKLLIEDTIKHTGIDIFYDININTPIPTNIEKVVYNSLLEGLTNGIKHGNCTSFEFKLSAEENTLSFYLKDNGVGTKELVLGFGLTVMKEGIEDLNGEFNFNCGYENGCTLSFTIPI